MKRRVPGRSSGGRARGGGAARRRLRHGRRRERGRTPDTQNGQQLFTPNCGVVPHAVGGRHERDDRPEPRQRLRRRRQAGLSRRARSRTSSSTRSGSARGRSRPTRRARSSSAALPERPGEVQTPMPANIVKGQDAIDVAAYVASVAGQGGSTRQRRVREPRHRRRGDLQGSGLRRLPHARGRRRDRDDRPEPRPAQAATAVVVHQVTVGGGVDAGVPGEADPGPDPGRRAVRLLLRREVALETAAGWRRRAIARVVAGGRARLGSVP